MGCGLAGAQGRDPHSPPPHMKQDGQSLLLWTRVFTMYYLCPPNNADFFQILSTLLSLSSHSCNGISEIILWKFQLYEIAYVWDNYTLLYAFAFTNM